MRTLKVLGLLAALCLSAVTVAHADESSSCCKPGTTCCKPGGKCCNH